MTQIEKDIEFLSSFCQKFLTQSIQELKKQSKKEPECFREAKDYFVFHKKARNNHQYSVFRSSEKSPLTLKLKNDQYERLPEIRVQVNCEVAGMSDNELIKFLSGKIFSRMMARHIPNIKQISVEGFYHRPKLKYVGAKNFDKLVKDKYCFVGGKTYNFLHRYGDTKAVWAIADGIRRLAVLPLGSSDVFPYGECQFFNSEENNEGK